MDSSPQSRMPVLVAAAAAVLAAGLGSVFFGRFRPARLVLLEIAVPLATAVIVLLASFAAGMLALRFTRWLFGRFAGETNAAIDDASTAEAVLIGIPTLGSVIGAVAWAALPLRASAIAIAAIASMYGLLLAWRRLDSIRPRAPRISLLAAVLLAPPILLGIIEAITPVNSPDELVYKLAVPQTYLMYDRMLELPLNSDSYFPFALHLADMISLAISGGIAAKIVRLVAYILTLAVVHRFARRIMARPIWAVAVLAWTPALMIIAGWCWEEWALIGLLLVSFDRFERWIDDGGGASHAAVCAAALAGALASKYTTLPWLLVFGAIAAVRLLQTPSLHRARVTAVTLVVLVVFGGLFYLRNVVWTGSPVAPLLLPNSPAIENFRSGEKLGGWIEAARGYDIFHAGFIDESLGMVLPLMVLLSPLILLRRERTAIDLFALGALQMVILLSIGPGSRLMITGLFPLALCGSAVMSETWDLVRAPLRTLLAVAAAVCLAGQLVLVTFALESDEVLPYLAGKVTAREYLSRTRAFMAPYAWLAANTPQSSKVLLLGENRSFYLPRRGIAGGNLDGPRVAEYLGRNKTPDSLAARLRSEGVTHILVHSPWYRVATPQSPPLTMLENEYLLQVSPDTHRVLTAMLATRCALRYRDREYLIYEIVR